MTKQEALDWLNYRLKIDKEMMRNNHFTITDLEFFMKFIKEKSGKDVNINSIINSIRFYSDSCLDWVERLINYLIWKHNIEIVTDDRVDIFTKMASGLPGDSLKILKYK